jgi:mannose-6-phosphate isomerase
MAKLECPLLLSPVYKEKIWGRPDLAPVFRSPNSSGEGKSVRLRSRRAFAAAKRPLIGEVWLTADESRFVNGPPAGLTLAEACREYGRDLVGESWWARSQNTDPLRFPVLAKYLFTSDWLSIQVHPDDDYARQHESGSLGKCEMWYIVKAERTARYLLGLKPGVTKEALRSACEQGTSRALLREFRTRPAEEVFIPPGTVHALGPGLILFEAEQNSDVTYRLDDFGRLGTEGRPRPLHLEQGLEVVRLDLPPRRALPEIRLREAFGTRRLIVACPFFAVEELLLRRSACLEGSPHRAEVLSVLEGGGRLETDAGWMAYRAGTTWVVPPAAAKYRLVPADRSRLLKCYVPEIEQDFRRPLERKRVPLKKSAQVCFH